MTDLEFVVKMLQGCNYAAIAREVDLDRKTVWAIATGRNLSPSFKTVQSLADYFRSKAS